MPNDAKQSKEPELNIRLAAPEDFPEVLEIAWESLKENAFISPSLHKLAQEIWAALHKHHGICGVIGPSSGEIQGYALLRIGTVWYSDTPLVEEKAIFIHPKYRNAKGGRAKKLCEFSKRVADKLELPLIIGVLSNFRTAAKIRMYERVFGPASGAYFLYNARTGQPQVQADQQQVMEH